MAVFDGGAVWTRHVFDLKVHHCRFTNNTASPETARDASAVGVGLGGALSVHNVRTLVVGYDSRGQPRRVSK